MLTHHTILNCLLVLKLVRVEQGKDVFSIFSRLQRDKVCRHTRSQACEVYPCYFGLQLFSFSLCPNQKCNNATLQNLLKIHIIALCLLLYMRARKHPFYQFLFVIPKTKQFGYNLWSSREAHWLNHGSLSIFALEADFSFV
jgi:hypothetical protein